jgi:hypothetical protein
MEVDRFPNGTPLVFIAFPHPLLLGGLPLLVSGLVARAKKKTFAN